MFLRSMGTNKDWIGTIWECSDSTNGSFKKGVVIMIVHDTISFRGFSLFILHWFKSSGRFTVRLEPKIAGAAIEQFNLLIKIFMFPRLLGKYHPCLTVFTDSMF